MIAAPKDPYLITPDQKSKYESQFMRLQPINGLITGEQAKGLFLQSGLPPQVLAKIWELADVDADGRMDVNEFCIALHLIALKLKGVDPPPTLPQSLRVLVEPPKFDAFGMSSAAPLPQAMGIPVASMPGVASSVAATMAAFVAPAPAESTAPPGRPPPPRSFDNLSSGIASMNTATITTMSTTSQPPSQVGGVIIDSAKLQRAGSITSGDYPSSMMLTEWAIPQPSKLKYTQLFNTHDRTRTGFLTGPQARNILLQSGLPQATLAQIWNLSDIDADGRLTCEEFVLAMHLIDCVKVGDTIPGVLPPDLIPPSLRRRRSLSGNVPVPQPIVAPVADLMGITAEDISATLMGKMGMATFEDRRRENFEKGQAELDRRRQLLLDQQKREQQERERKEREEAEKRERIRLEQEMRRQQELEKQMQKQKEIEAEKEEQRRKLLEQREAARREMERQRMIEWENQRKQELQLQKQKLLETISQMKSRKTSLIIDMEKVNNQFNQVHEQVEDAKKKVGDAKGEIDKMRYDRDVKLKEINFLKTQMKTLQDRQLIIEQEKLNLATQLKNIALTSGVHGVTDSTQFALQTRQSTINQLKSQLEEAEVERKQKIEDVENSNNQLKELKNMLNAIVSKTKSLQDVYDKKREEAIKLKEKAQQSQQPVQDFDTGWADNGGWVEQKQEDVVYKAVFPFEARNEDELTVNVDDIVTLVPDPTAESGWIKGSCNGKVGWLPEAYLEKIESNVETIETTQYSNNGFAETKDAFKDAFKPSKDSSFVAPTPKALPPDNVTTGTANITAVASYPWKGTKDNNLSFNKGEIITVTEQQDMWWCGELNGKSGWFPKSYVKPLTASGDEVQQEPEYYVSLYAFETQEPGDLAFDANEIICVTKKDGDWWTGEIGTDRCGIFPSNYVREAQPEEVPKPREPTPPTAVPQPMTPVADKKDSESESTAIPGSVEASPSRFVDSPKLKKSKLKKPEVVKVIAAYKATGPEQLNLEKGQLIQVRKKNSSGWWEGEIQVKGKKRQIGWFPASYVKSLNPTGSGSGGSSARSTPDPSKSEIDTAEKVIAIYGFKAQHDDELSFEADDIIKVLSKEDATWWKGQLISTGAIGLFPSNHVQAYKRLSTNFSENKSISINGEKFNHCDQRQKHIQEFITTEDAYVKDMQLVVDVFQRPLIESRVITIQEFNAIFLNWNDLIKCNKSFVKALKAVKRQSVKCSNGEIDLIGNVFCEHIPYMSTVYTKFCSQQLKSAKLLQMKHDCDERFVEIEKQCKYNCRANGLPLSTYLLKPMQRITKYPLLIKKILENTSQEHCDYMNCHNALYYAQQLCDEVNEACRLQENDERMDWIQRHVKLEGVDEVITLNSETNILGARVLLHCGYLIKVNSNKELLGFLFNDFLLLCVPIGKEIGKVNNIFSSDKALSSKYHLYKKPFFFDDIDVFNANNQSNISHSSESMSALEMNGFSNGDPLVFVLGIKSLSRTFMLKATSMNDKAMWIKSVVKCRSNYNQALQAKNVYRKSLNINSGIGRLLVTVMEAVKLTSRNSVLNTFCSLSLGSLCKEQQEHEECHSTSVVRCFSQSPTFVDSQHGKFFKAKWSDSMQFFIDRKPLHQQCLAIHCYEKNHFSPNCLIGKVKINLQEIDEEITQLPSGPINKSYKLNNNAVIYLKLDIKYFND